ncbi:MAG: alpha/beta hydrolase [Terriglobia bacterium]
MEHFLTSAIRRYYQLEVPSATGPSATGQDKRWPLLIALHGYEGNKDSMMAVARAVGGSNMVVISLQGPHQFFIERGRNDPTQRRNYTVGFGWGTSYKMEEAVELHHENIRELISLAVRRFHADRQKVFLMAFSQACSYNYRFVFTYPRTILGVISVCGGVPGDWETNLRYQAARTHVLHIAATHDEWYTREKNVEFKRMLARRAASVDFRFYRSPHKFPRRSIPRIRTWIAKIMALNAEGKP